MVIPGVYLRQDASLEFYRVRSQFHQMCVTRRKGGGMKVKLWIPHGIRFLLFWGAWVAGKHNGETTTFFILLGLFVVSDIYYSKRLMQ